MAGRKYFPKFSTRSSFGFISLSPRQKEDIVITQRVDVEVQARTSAPSGNTSWKFEYIRRASACCWFHPFIDRSPVR